MALVIDGDAEEIVGFPRYGRLDLAEIAALWLGHDRRVGDG